MAASLAHHAPLSDQVLTVRNTSVRKWEHARYASILRVVTAACRFRSLMFHHQRGLCEREQENQRDDAPDLESDPCRGRGDAPYRLIDYGQRKEEHAPAHGELSPARLAKFERLRKNIFDEQAVGGESAQQHDTEEAVKNSRFH